MLLRTSRPRIMPLSVAKTATSDTAKSSIPNAKDAKEPGLSRHSESKRDSKHEIKQQIDEKARPERVAGHSVPAPERIAGTVVPAPDVKTIGFNESSNRARGAISIDSKEAKIINPNVKGLCGLVNLGNKCYFDSVVQALRHLMPFTEYLNNRSFVDSLQKRKEERVNIILEQLQKEVREGKRIIDEKEINKEKLLIQECSASTVVRLCKLFSNMWSVTGTNTVIRPEMLLKVLCASSDSNRRFFNPPIQQDSREANTFILGTIHDDICRPVSVELKQMNSECNQILDERKRMITICKDEKTTDTDKKIAVERYKKLKNDNLLAVTILKSYKAWAQHIKNNQYSIVTDLFTGLSRAILHCPECNHKTDKFDPYTDLYLEIPTPPDPNLMNATSSMSASHSSSAMDCSDLSVITPSSDAKKITLIDCLDHYFQHEILGDNDQWKCPNCEIRVNAKIKYSLWTVPKILVIVLKRFINKLSGSTGRVVPHKNTKPVQFPFELDMTPYIDPLNEIKEGKTKKYELISVVNHSGSLGSGHYYCYAKNPYDQNFYEFNDEHVSLIPDRDNVVTSEAYLLYYQLMM